MIHWWEFNWYYHSGPSESRNYSNYMVPPIPQSSKTGASPSDALVTYLGHLLGGSYPFAEMQSAYSTAPTYWVALKRGMLKKTAYLLHFLPILKKKRNENLKGSLLWSMEIFILGKYIFLIFFLTPINIECNFTLSFFLNTPKLDNFTRQLFQNTCFKMQFTLCEKKKKNHRQNYK